MKGPHEVETMMMALQNLRREVAVLTKQAVETASATQEVARLKQRIEDLERENLSLELQLEAWMERDIGEEHDK